MNKKYEYTKEQVDTIIKEYMENYQPVINIAKSFRVDGSVIKRILNENGITVINGSAFSKEYWIKRGLSEDESIEKTKKMKPCCVEYWLSRGCDLETSKFNVENHLMNTERAFILKYGLEDGKIKFKEKKEKDGKFNSPRKISYWINKGFNEDDGKLNVAICQNNFSYESCIKKYGEIEGQTIFNDRQIKWQESLAKNGNMKMGYSKISQELFYTLLELYVISDKDKIYFATHNKELRLNKDNGGIWLYDFTDTINMKIIEYNGDMYHANPKKYKANDYPHPFRKKTKSEDIWKKDKEKYDVAVINGYKVLNIWDSDYRNSKKKTIKKCKEFLKNNEK